MTKFDHEAVKTDSRKRNAEIVSAAMDHLLVADNIGEVDERMPLALSAALHVIARQMRERGQALIDAKRKGAIGANKTLGVAAAELENVAVSLTEDGAEDIRTASQVAGVAVSLERDGAELKTRELVFDDNGMPIGGHTACGDTHEWENPELHAYGSEFCNRMTGHEGDHTYRDGHVEISWAPAGALCAATPQYGPPNDDRCILFTGHDGNHEGASMRWPNTETEKANHDVEIMHPDPVIGDGATVTIDGFDIVAPDAEPAIVPQPFTLNEATARPRRGHRSASQISLYNECGMKYRLSYRDGIAEVPAWWNIGGTTFHRCAEKIAKRWPDLTTWEADGDRDDMVARFAALWRAEFADEIAATQLANLDHPQSTWRAAAKSAEGKTWWQERGPEMVSTYYAWHCSRLREGWAVQGAEVEFAYDVNGVKVVGVIDRIDCRGDEFEIIDYKSSGTKPADSFQLGQYADWLFDSLEGADMKISAGYYFARKGEFELTPRPVRERHPFEQIAYQVTTMDAAERAGVYLANTATAYGGCNSCALRRHCPVGATR